MKVLHFYKTSVAQSRGGVEVFIDALCHGTAGFGVRNTVLSLAKEPLEETNGTSSYRSVQVKRDLYIASTAFSASAFRKFGQLAGEADVVHYHFPNPFADVLHFVCRIEKPTVVTYHSDIIRQANLLRLYEPLMKRFLRSVHRIVATSPNYFATSRMLQDFSEKVSVIPIGIDKENYPAIDEKRLEYWRERLPRPFFLFLGAMRYYKGLPIALDAVKGTNLRLVLAGINGMWRKLKAYANKHRLDNVRFLGFTSDEDKVALLHLCHGFVFPSHLRSEAFGIALVEAAAYGKPLISCEIGTGTSFVNVHQETGLVIEPSSPDALRKAMHYLIEHPAKALAFGLNAERRYKTHFTAEKQARAYFNVYRNLLG